MMEARIQKWGDSLALLIPKELAQQLGLSVDNQVKISVKGDRLIIELAQQVTLDDLLARVTPENLHGETDWGEYEG